jgi:peptidoglycan/LPS O-acetylase OafA/YrhL
MSSQAIRAFERRSGRSHALDGLRGIAACAVIFYHGILAYDSTLIDRVLMQPIQASGTARDLLTKIALTASDGHAAVYLFFVLSGAVLRLSLERRADDGALPLCLAFAGARLLRLYPPVIVCLLLFYGMGHVGIPEFPVFTPNQLIANATLWDTRMHVPSTTIQAEVMAIPFILIAWLLRRRFGLPALVFCLIYSMLAIDSGGWMVFHLPNMHAYLVGFMGGMLAAEPMLRPLIRQVPAGSWWMALGALVLCRIFHSHASIAALLAMVLAASLLVAGLLHGERGSLTVMLERPLLQAMGRVSFSLYLLNVPVLILILTLTKRWAWPRTHALEAGIITGLFSLALTWPLAWASERWIERPSVSAGGLCARAVRGWASPLENSDARAANAGIDPLRLRRLFLQRRQT